MIYGDNADLIAVTATRSEFQVTAGAEPNKLRCESVEEFISLRYFTSHAGRRKAE